MDRNFKISEMYNQNKKEKKNNEMQLLTVYDNTVYEINEFDFNTSSCQQQMNIEQPPAKNQKSTKFICWNRNELCVCVSCVLVENDFLWKCYIER